MRALLVVASCTSAHAERRTNAIAKDDSCFVCAGTLPWHLRRRDTHAVQVGGGISGWQPELHLGFHPTDRWLVRVHERFVSRELEAAYGIENGNRFGAGMPLKVFAFVGTGVTNERESIVHGGMFLRLYPSIHTDWLAFEVGVRWNYVPSERALVARAVQPTHRAYELTAELTAAVSFLLPPKRDCW